MNASIHLSEHAIHRSQQRSIPEIVIACLIEYGQAIPVRGKAISYTLTAEALREAKSDLPERDYQYLEKKKNAYVIVSDEGTVITTAWSKNNHFKLAA